VETLKQRHADGVPLLVWARDFKICNCKLRTTRAAMADRSVCRELGISRQTFYRHVSPKGDFRPAGEKLFEKSKPSPRRREQRLGASHNDDRVQA
jgi:hypothetical protein